MDYKAINEWADIHGVILEESFTVSLRSLVAAYKNTTACQPGYIGLSAVTKPICTVGNKIPAVPMPIAGKLR